jgi:hypothetical protein
MGFHLNSIYWIEIGSLKKQREQSINKIFILIEGVGFENPAYGCCAFYFSFFR